MGNSLKSMCGEVWEAQDLEEKTPLQVQPLLSFDVVLWENAFPTSWQIFLRVYDQLKMIATSLGNYVHPVCILLTHHELDLTHQIFSPNRVDKT